MTTVTPHTLGRAQFLLSKFKFQEVTEQKTRGPKLRNFMFFDFQLPPACNLGKAIDQAISNENFEVFVADTDEVTAEQVHNIKYLFDLFTRVDPIRVEGEMHYHYHPTKMYEAALGATDAANVIAHYARYQAPTQIKSYTDAESIYYGLTVALRKGCDSPVTSALWNMAQALDLSTIMWMRAPFVKMLQTPEKYPTFESFAVAAKQACLSQEPDDTKQQAILCLYRIFTDQDWEGYVSYLIQS